MTPRHTRAAILAACRKMMRVRASRDAFRHIAKTALYGRRLAEIETRATEPWAIQALAGGSTP